MFAITRGKIVFENVLLEQEQKDLLAALVHSENARAIHGLSIQVCQIKP
jgi:hypothetical protein